jgi:hypothetical protein
VGQVRKHLQELKEPIKLAGLTEELEEHLDQRLCAATGGAPRLLLYTLRALHYACVFNGIKLDSAESIDGAVNDHVYQLLYSVPTVRRELSPSDAKAETKRAYGLLLACVLYRKHLHYETKIAFGDQEYPVSRLLKSQAFFLSREHQNLQPGEFVLTFPEYHLRAMQTEYRTGVPMLLSCFAGAALPMAEPWRLFEILPAHAMAVSAALGTDDPMSRTWSDVVPAFFADSAIAKRMLFDLGGQPFSIHREEKLLDVLQDSTSLERLCCCGAVVGPDKSNSADMVHIQRLRDDKGRLVVAVMEWQSKLLITSDFSMAELADEVNKERGQCPVVLTILCSRFGKILLDILQKQHVLVLQSWSEKESAEFVLPPSGVLYWRPKTGDDVAWCKWPEVLPASPQPATGNSKVVTVRPQLEVVLPHPDVMRAVLGSRLVDGVMAAARPDAAEPSAIISDLDTILARKGIRAAAIDKYGALSDATPMADVMAMIAEERGFSEEERSADVQVLAQLRIRTVGDLRVLSRVRVENLALSPVIVEYLLRVINGKNE